MRGMFLSLLCAALALGLSQSVSTAGGEGGDVVDLGGSKAKLPAGWKMEQPSSKLRLYQVRIPKAEGDSKDAEMIVFFFGKGSGGGVKENLKRWKEMFRAPAGKDIEDVSSVEKFKAGDAQVTKLDVRGTYLFKPAPFVPKVTPIPQQRMFAVVFDNDEGPFFLRLVGPEKTVSQQAKQFDNWLKSFK